jgi:hypothetical protein
METSAADGGDRGPFAAHWKSANRAGRWRTGGLPLDPGATPPGPADSGCRKSVTRHFSDFPFGTGAVGSSVAPPCQSGATFPTMSNYHDTFIRVAPD